jgi:DNA-binding winged helix-turn-helix (wHTH) protein/tetratricopeptide (TPR) repeat protein
MPSSPQRDHLIRFGRFTFDATNARLCRGDEVIPLRGKTLAVLEYLTARPGQLVSKDELLAAVWPEVYVSEDVLVGCVRELRAIFGDTRGAARYVETVYRRGYRWIAEIQGVGARGSGLGEDSGRFLTPSPQPLAPSFVGREADLAQLRQWLECAARGARQVVFVTGETGIGKTALVDEFVGALGAPNPLPPTSHTPFLVARGKCVEQYGPAEPFLPLLDALSRLSRDPRNTWAAAALQQRLPEGMLSSSAARTSSPAATIMPDRAVRLLGEAVEALANERVLILVLEDLHWSDPSTLDVLSYLAQRPESSRLMVLATYRPTDLILLRHPLRRLEQELRARQCSSQLALSRLTVHCVQRWLERRCPSPPQSLVEWLHRRTDGHPLFLVTLFEALVAAGLVECGDGEWHVQPGYADFGVPESLRLMIDRQAERLDNADRLLLEAASAAGMQFSAASVAAAVEQDLVSVEKRCSALARDGHFLRAADPSQWPDGTVAGSYQFTHELYRHVLYESLSPAHKRLLHHRLGHRLEQAYGQRADEVATELSLHFERGRDPARAINYLEKAVTHCTRRGAHREAIATIRRALEMVALLPDTPERTDRMLFLNLRLGALQLVAEDYADPAVEATFQRCRQLAEQAQALPPLLSSLAGLHTCYAARAQLADSARIIPLMVALAEQLPFPETTLVAHASGAWCYWSCGELATAHQHSMLAIAAQPAEPIEFPSTFDVVAYAFGSAAFIEMGLGNLATARARVEQAVAWSRQTARPVDRATALALACMFYAFINDLSAAGERAREAVAVAEEHGYRQWSAMGRIVTAWVAAVTEQSAGSLADVIARIDEYTGMGMLSQLSAFLCLAASAHLGAGKKRAGLQLLARAEAHMHDTGERWYEAELHRLRGELVQARDPQKAEASFQHAIDVARAQGAKLWELRASVSLATLWRQEKKMDTARQLLEPILSSFAGGLDAPDLQAARALQARLA